MSSSPWTHKAIADFNGQLKTTSPKIAMVIARSRGNVDPIIVVTQCQIASHTSDKRLTDIAAETRKIQNFFTTLALQTSKFL